jgi:hypothetical protein
MAAMASNYCCYFDHRYLPRGVAMIRSLKRWDPAAVVWVLCLSDECFQALSELEERGVNLVRIDDLETAYPALGEARRNRTTIEFYFTCTPSLVRFVLRQAGEGAVVTYVDGDLYFFSDPEPLFAELGHNSVSIIPHRFPPRLRHLEKFGLYNVGWMSFRNDPRGQAVASWWQDRCNEWCYDILDGDRFADQKYLDRIATEFDGVVVLSHRGANLAPWNLGGHRLTLRNNGVVVDGQWPLIFFHFHGLKRVGNGLYMPDHFRYHAPFIGLIQGASTGPIFKFWRRSSARRPLISSLRRPPLRGMPARAWASVSGWPAGSRSRRSMLWRWSRASSSWYAEPPGRASPRTAVTAQPLSAPNDPTAPAPSCG